MILICAEKDIYAKYIHKGFSELYENLEAVYDNKFLEHENLNWTYLMKTYGQIPKVIVVFEFNEGAPWIKKLLPDVIVVTVTLDIHYWDKKGRELKLNTYNGSDYLIAFYNKFVRFYGVNKKILPVVHPACTVFGRKDINLNTEKKIFFFGATTPQHYPLRVEFLNLMNKKYPDRIVIKKHPGYDQKTKEETFRTTQETSDELYRYFCVFGTGLFPKFEIDENESDTYYLAAKIMEILGSGALLLCNDYKIKEELESLGFYRDTHYKHIDRHNFDSVISWLFDPVNEQEIMNIRNKGHQLAMGKYTSQIINSKIKDFLHKLDNGESVEDLVVDSK
jgi:hypothetical protein